MAVFLLPLQNTPQTFEIPLAGQNYSLTCKWNDVLEGGWIMDLGNADTGQILAFNIPLITGANLLAGLEYLGVGGKLYVYTDGNDSSVPTLDNLGVQSNVYFVTEDT